MSRPDFFDIEYEINAWMHKENHVDRELAERQWLQIKQIYNAIGVAVEELTPVGGLPDLVFTANAGLVIDGKVMLARFLNPERQGETPVNEAWFKANGFANVQLPQNVFEGEGDCLYAQETLFAGHGFRSDVKSHAELKDFFGKPVVSLKLVDPHFYHLDTCFCPLDDETVMFLPAAFDEASVKAIRSHFKTVIEPTAHDAAAFGLNAVSYNRKVVISNEAEDLIETLKQHDFTPIATPITEFHKSGGGVKCVTLELRN